MHILVCDDDAAFSAKVAEYAATYFEAHEIPVQATVCSDPEQVLAIPDLELYRIAFLDVDMPQVNGIALGGQLRHRNPDICLVYVSAYLAFALDGYKVNAYRYILKRDVAKQLPSCLEDIYASMMQAGTKTLTVHHNRETIRIPLDQIYYLESEGRVIEECIAEVCYTMGKVTRIYDRTLIAVFKENRKVLREMVQQSNDLFYRSRERKYKVMPLLLRLQDNEIDSGHYYVQVVDYMNEITKSLLHVTRPCFDHIDNNHEGMTREQIEDLMKINDEVETIFTRINVMLRNNDFADIDLILELRDELFESIADAIKRQLKRIKNKQSSTKASLLYLTILNETKTMVLQARNLVKSQRYFLEHKTE